MKTMTPEEAVRLARSHVDTWNSHDLEAILQLYTPDAELQSPLAATLCGDAVVRGREALRVYFSAGLAKYPDLKLELLDTFLGHASIALLIRGAGRRLVSEVLFLDDAGKVTKVCAHYLCGG